jgi:hypothetical protein
LVSFYAPQYGLRDKEQVMWLQRVMDEETEALSRRHAANTPRRSGMDD